MIDNPNEENNFPHELLLNDFQISKILKVFANVSSANIEFLKAELSKMIQSGEILADLLAAIPKVLFNTKVTAFKKAASKTTEIATKVKIQK